MSDIRKIAKYFYPRIVHVAQNTFLAIVQTLWKESKWYRVFEGAEFGHFTTF